MAKEPKPQKPLFQRPWCALDAVPSAMRVGGELFITWRWRDDQHRRKAHEARRNGWLERVRRDEKGADYFVTTDAGRAAVKADRDAREAAKKPTAKAA